MLTPNSLYPGAKVALLCASSAVPEERLEPSIAAVKALGLDPVVYPSCYYVNRHGYFAADDAQRAKDLQDAFADPAIQGILCIRGGYGAHRILPLLNLRDIARHPKLFAGYSDVTALHTAFNQVCRFVTYHTPMPSTEWYQGLDEYTATYLRRALFGALTGPMPLLPGAETLSPGMARGVLCGGNLSLVSASMGTPWQIDARGCILYLEDVSEEVYALERMLYQLRYGGVLDSAAGLVFGAFTDCRNARRADYGPEALLRDFFAGWPRPVLYNVRSAHCTPMVTLPMGAACTIDGGAGTMTVRCGC